VTTFHSGFVTVVGRPNVGKSTLVNRLVGAKVAITSDRPQTTRTEIRGVRTSPASQIVFLDTPGLHKPRTALGERTNQRALATLAEVDLVCQLVDATAAIGPGDRFVADAIHQVATPRILVVNKVDRAAKAAVAEHLASAADRLGDYDAFVPLSAKTGDGTDALLGEIGERLPEGPAYYPEGVVTDQPETFLAAEVLREKLLALTRDELPHSITVACEVDETLDARDTELVRLLVTVHVERDSQKGMVIGRGGRVLKEAGTAARLELEALLGTRIHLETKVRVERDWQRRPASLDRLGY
jgi:GTP-binding protein Era